MKYMFKSAQDFSLDTSIFSGFKSFFELLCTAYLAACTYAGSQLAGWFLLTNLHTHPMGSKMEFKILYLL